MRKCYNNHEGVTMDIEKEEPQTLYEIDLNEKKYEKILKANSIIRGRVVSDGKLKLNIYDMRVLNFLLKTLEQCVRNDNKPKEFTTVIIPMEIFKKVVDDNQNWRQNFIKTVKKLEQIAFELNNYKDWEKDTFTLWKKTRLVISPEFIIENKTKNAVCKVTFSQQLAIACWQKLDYTHINFQTVNSFKSKYALKIYEVLVSKIQYHVNCNDLKTEYDITKEELENMFNEDLSKGNIKNGFKNWLSNIIKFDNVIKELKKHIKIYEYKIYSKDRIISFKISEDEIIKYKTKKDDNIDLGLQKFKDIIDPDKVVENYNQRVYQLNKEKVEDVITQFLGNIATYYTNKSLFEREEEIETFGDVVINYDGEFYYKKTKKVLTYSKVKTILNYLYKNHYERIMKEINKIKSRKPDHIRNSLFD